MSAHDVFFVQSPQLGSDSNSGAARNGTPAMENSEVHMKLPAYRSATVFTWCTSVPHRRPVRPVRWPTIRVQLRYTLWRLSTRRLSTGRAWPSGEAGGWLFAAGVCKEGPSLRSSVGPRPAECQGACAPPSRRGAARVARRRGDALPAHAPARAAALSRNHSA